MLSCRGFPQFATPPAPTSKAPTTMLRCPWFCIVAKAWMDAAKGPGGKSKFVSLTRSFAAVAILLQFDEDLVFEEHLQMEYSAENLW